jgi:ATP-dependent DNA ligase
LAPERLRELRAVEVLEHIGTADAKQLLQAFASGQSEARRLVSRYRPGRRSEAWIKIKPREAKKPLSLNALNQGVSGSRVLTSVF